MHVSPLPGLLVVAAVAVVSLLFASQLLAGDAADASLGSQQEASGLHVTNQGMIVATTHVAIHVTADGVDHDVAPSSLRAATGATWGARETLCVVGTSASCLVQSAGPADVTIAIGTRPVMHFTWPGPA